MLQVKLSPRRETLRLRIDRTLSDRTSSSCPSPAGEEAAARRAMPVKGAAARGALLPATGKLLRMGKSSKFASTARWMFAICSPHEASVLRSGGAVKCLCRTAFHAQSHPTFGAERDRRPHPQFLGCIAGQREPPVACHEGQNQHPFHPRQAFANALPRAGAERE